MARKTKIVTITAEGRDKAKIFLITEMSARQAEAWADRAFLALAHSSIDLPAGIEHSGMAGISQIMTLLADTQLPNADALMEELVSSVRIASIATTARLVGHIKFPELTPLMDELMSCVQFVWDTSKNLTRPLVDNGTEGDDLEEVATRQFLRSEVLDLHVNFLLAAVVLNSIAAASEMRTLPILETMQMSQQPSAPSSPATGT
jgi:hypothetical protein